MATTNDELACVYAALILADDKIAITVNYCSWFWKMYLSMHWILNWQIKYLKKGDKINALLKAASYEVAPYWPGLFANALEGIKVTDLICNLGSAPAAGAAPAAAAAPVAAAKKEEPKKGTCFTWTVAHSIRYLNVILLFFRREEERARTSQWGGRYGLW